MGTDSLRFEDPKKSSVTPLRLCYATHSDVLQELTLRALLRAHAGELPRKEIDPGYIAIGSTPELKAAADTLAKSSRRRLTSDTVGYGSPLADGSGPRRKVWSHDHASTRRHIRRLMASEAAGHAC